MPLLTRPTPRTPRVAAGAAAAALASRGLGRMAASVAAAVGPAHLAAGRTGIGGVMLVRPTAVPRLLGVDSAAATRTAWVGRMLGAREVGLGVGTLWALRAPGRGAAGWVLAGALCDSLDVLAVGGALARGRLRPATGVPVVLSALAAAALGAGSASSAP